MRLYASRANSTFSIVSLLLKGEGFSCVYTGETQEFGTAVDFFECSS